MRVVQTVLGIIPPQSLGRTLPHEHISLNFESFYCHPPPEVKPYLEQKITMKTLGYLRHYPYSSLENLHFCDENSHAAVRDDLALFKKFGGGSIVENSSHGLSRNLRLMGKISETTGVHIIAGTGHYVHSEQTTVHANMTVEQMVNLYSNEIMTGLEVERFGIVKCGFIGEVGSVYPIHDFEKRAIRAAGEAQEIIGCGVSFHPGRSEDAPFEIIRLYLEAGGRADKCVMSHLDRTISGIQQLLEFAQTGCYLQYDLFGNECSFYQLNATVDMPSDAQRINNIMRLIEEGLIERLLISHDIHTKHRLTSYGGHGYHHLFVNILPRLLARGLTLENVEQMIVCNPSKWLELNM